MTERHSTRGRASLAARENQAPRGRNSIAQAAALRAGLGPRSHDWPKPQRGEILFMPTPRMETEIFPEGESRPFRAFPVDASEIPGLRKASAPGYRIRPFQGQDRG